MPTPFTDTLAHADQLGDTFEYWRHPNEHYETIEEPEQEPQPEAEYVARHAERQRKHFSFRALVHRAKHRR